MEGKTMDTIELRQGEDEQWRWTRISSNGEVVGASTESYKDVRDAAHNIDATQAKPFLLVRKS